MADEAVVVSSLQIAKGNLQVRSFPDSFRADVTGTKGPTPGALTVTTDGKIVSLAELGTPGLCIIRNLDDTNYVEYGVYDGFEFYPLGEVLPGEHYIIRLSRNFSESYLGTSLGTDPAGTTSLMVKANTASCVVSVEAYEA